MHRANHSHVSSWKREGNGTAGAVRRILGGESAIGGRRDAMQPPGGESGSARTNEDEAIASVADELGSSQAVYGFIPADVEEKFFLGEAALALAAGTFIAAFLKGVNASLEKRGEAAGEKVTNWLIDKVGGLFRKTKVSEADVAQVKEKIRTEGESVTRLSAKTAKSRSDAAERRIAEVLVEQGVTPAEAERIAKKTREAATRCIPKRRAHGTKRR